MKWSVKIFFDRELHRMHLRKSSLQNSSALVQTLFLQKSTEKSLLIPMRSIKSAQCYISRTISRRQKFFCENRPIFGMVRDAEVRTSMIFCLCVLTFVSVLSIIMIGSGKRVAMAIYSVGVICLFVLAYLAIHGSFA